MYLIKVMFVSKVKHYLFILHTHINNLHIVSTCTPLKHFIKVLQHNIEEFIQVLQQELIQLLQLDLHPEEN